MSLDKTALDENIVRKIDVRQNNIRWNDIRWNNVGQNDVRQNGIVPFLTVANVAKEHLLKILTSQRNILDPLTFLPRRLKLCPIRIIWRKLYLRPPSRSRVTNFPEILCLIPETAFARSTTGLKTMHGVACVDHLTNYTTLGPNCARGIYTKHEFCVEQPKLKPFSLCCVTEFFVFQQKFLVSHKETFNYFSLDILTCCYWDMRVN
jgi:hypothetical protein